ncbi:MAG: hypothetical protein ACUVWV_12215 [Thermodesulfobacteriota bacterium]
MKALGYSILALILFYLFLLVQFPYDAIKKKVALDFAQSNMGNLKIGQVGPSFPFDLYLQNISWNIENLGIQIPDLIVGVNIYKTVLGNIDIEINDLKNPPRLYGKYFSAMKEGSLKIRLDKTELKAIYKKDYSLNINISGEAKLQWVGENYEKVDGEFWVLLQIGGIEVYQEGSLPIFLKNYDKLKAEMEIKKGNLWAKRLVISGKEGGEMVLKNLNLSELMRGQSFDFIGKVQSVPFSAVPSESMFLNLPKPK